MYIKTPQSLFILMFSLEKNDQKAEHNFVHNIITLGLEDISEMITSILREEANFKKCVF